jgi:hypothetical protein
MKWHNFVRLHISETQTCADKLQICPVLLFEFIHGGCEVYGVTPSFAGVNHSTLMPVKIIGRTPRSRLRIYTDIL